MITTDKSVGDEQGHFRKGRKYVDQVFALKIVTDKYLEKNSELFATVIHPEEASDS